MFQEQILLVSGLNGTELLRTLARFGKSTFGLRIMSAGELAETALLRSGITLPEKLLPAGSEPAVFAGLLREIPYFFAASLEDAENVSASLRSLRLLLPDDEEKQLEECLCGGEFEEKNRALLDVYRSYVRFLETEQLMDTVGLLRFAVSRAKPLHAELLTLEEYPVTPLEERLLYAVSGGNHRCVTLQSLFGREEQSACTPKITVTRAYGASNEAEDVIAQIYRSALPLDECVIAAADPSACSYRIQALCSRLNVPVTFGTGLPIGLSFPATLLKKWKEWAGKGAFGKDTLRALLSCDALRKDKHLRLFGTEDPALINEIIDAAGGLRIGLSREANENRITSWSGALGEEKATLTAGVRLLASALESGCAAFIGEYAVIRNEKTDPASLYARLDRAAIARILQQMADYARFDPSDAPEALIDDLLTHTVCREMSREGSLYVTSIEAAPAALRKNLFVMGLSAASFPGSPREDYLVLDSDYLLLPNVSAAPTSGNRIRKRKEALHRLVRLGTACGCSMNFSYSGYRAAELKGENPSSVLFELYRELIDGDADMQEFRNFQREVGFYSTALYPSSGLGKAYVEGEVLAAPPADDRPVAPIGTLKLSPSAVETYLACPRRFYLRYLLHVPETDPDDPYEVINARDLGTLVHEQMEHLTDPKQPEEVFLTDAERAFDRFLLQRPPILHTQAEEVRRNYLTLVKNGYDTDPGNRLEYAEKELSALHPSGILLAGRTDRIERTPAGEYLIADYKNKRTIDHVSGDFTSCVQAVLYAWMAKENGIPVTGCEYRYLYQRTVISCPVNSDILEQMDNLLFRLKEALDSCSFPPAETADNSDGPCKYCRVREVCGIGRDGEEEA